VFEVGETDCELGEADTPELVETNVVSEAHVGDVPEYHLTVKVDVPPVQDAERDID
jgi:hypothetical protein